MPVRAADVRMMLEMRRACGSISRLGEPGDDVAAYIAANGLTAPKVIYRFR